MKFKAISDYNNFSQTKQPMSLTTDYIRTSLQNLYGESVTSADIRAWCMMNDSNYQNVTRAIRILNAPWGLGIGARKITVSTVGLPAAIEKLAKFEIPVTLALSLHAPNDDIRKELIPWAKFAKIKEILKACDIYFKATGREITLEYLLLHNVNDRKAHAKELASLCKTLRCNVNLIRYNEVPDLPFERPETEQVRRFQETLASAGVNSHIRASRGRDIAAACGQLKRQHITPSIEESS